jgi:methyltransferase (TIGR00027 family)
MFTTLKRVTCQVDDLTKAKRWYGDLLGSQPLFDSPFAVIFKVGDCSLSLLPGKSPLPEWNGRVDVYWAVDDIDEAYRRLIDLGAAAHTPPRPVLNIHIAKVTDPFGNVVGITGPSSASQGKSIENQPSHTAMSTAFCRALASRDERPGIKGPDGMAELFLTDEAKKLLANDASRTWAAANLVTSPLYGYMIARTAFIDDIFTKSLSERIPQIVILGAGYDTRTIRFRDSLGDTRVFELDIATTQTRKTDLLGSAGIVPPPNLTFVRINFLKERLEDVLAASGYDPRLKTLFVWEGVTYYLNRESVARTLRSVSAHSAPGSTVCFDYLTEKIESVNDAEPFGFWIEQTEIAQFLASCGIELTEDIDAKEMERRYLMLSDGSLAEQSLSRFRLACAAVTERG